MAADPLDPTLLRKQNRQQLLSDILRNARGAPEAALTMGTSLADMAGTGLGTLAGMAKQKLSGEDVNLDAATETLQEGKFTYAPRSEGGQETLRGLETVTAPIEKGAQWVGQKTTDVTGSPALGAAAYTALNVADPQLLAPAAAKVAALRGASRVARGATFEPVSSAGMGGKQRGAWSPGDIADVEGDFEMRSTVEEALGKLKPQEQKARGKQMLQVLKKYGAKEEELKWSGLNDVLAGDMPVSADEIRAHMQQSGVKITQSRRGEGHPDGEDGAANAIDEEAVDDKARELVYDSGDLEYPYSITRDGEEVATADNYRDAQRALRDEKASLIESETEHYLENISDFLDEETLADMDEAARQQWAQDTAESAVEDNYTWEMEQDHEADPHNYDELFDAYREEILRRPQDYGLQGSGGGNAKWENYVIDSPGGKQGENYGETIIQLQREGRFGRGVEGMSTSMVPDDYDTMTPFQKARYEALRAARNDPSTQRAAKEYKYTTHFDESNPLVYTRQSDWPKPPEATTEGGTRMIEELQSDWGQLGRKKGIFDPETAKAQAKKALEQAPQKYAELGNKFQELLARLQPNQVQDVARRSGYSTVEEFTESLGKRLEAEQQSPTNDFGTYVAALADNVYYATTDYGLETAARDLNSRALDLNSEINAGGSGGKALPAAPFIGDAKKFSQLAVQQAIADAVRKGDQYVGVSPGYTHAPERWGSEDLSWWTEQQTPPVNENQADMFGEGGIVQPNKRKVAARGGGNETTRGEKWKEMVRALRRGDDFSGIYNGPRVQEIDLDSPDAEAQLEQIVRDNLSYEANQYADPEKFIKDRTAKVLANMRKEQEGQYSPRSHGMNEFYDNIVPGVLEKVLKEAGSTGSGKGVVRGAEAPIGRPMAMVYDDTLGEWRPRELNSEGEVQQYKELAATQPDKYQFRPAQMHYIEIDPELARAAKRGFRLPF